jgi:hypothetical protein
MRALLSRAYAIPVIGVSLILDTDHNPPKADGVRIEVDTPDGARLLKDLTLDELGVPVDLPGIDRALARGVELKLPAGLYEELHAALEPVPTGEPIWLDFRRPFGYLPAIPWERLLQPHLGVPVLRLPFSAVSAPSATDPIVVAVCAPWSGTSALREFLATVVPALPAHAHVDVFTADQDVRRQSTPRSDVTFHEPPPDLAVSVEPPALSSDPVDTAEVENPWLRWMANTIAPDSVDVVHFICAARLSRNFGLLDFGAAPTASQNPGGLRLVSTGQLVACLTRLGAWSVSFAMPDFVSPEHGEAGLRILAHRMTGLLSGPVTVQAPAAGLAADLAAAYRFLYARTPEPAPATPTLTLACHPSYLQAAPGVARPPAREVGLAGEIESTVQDCTLDQGVLQLEPHGPTEPPAWLASSQRLLERWTSTLLGTDVDPADSRARATGATSALSFIASTIEDSVRENGSDR